jgi:ABC-2 type transport system ATP-binding protein
MDDVASLCPRVIVIDQGKLRYDGDLGSLVRSVRPHKRIALRLSGALDREVLSRVGSVVELHSAKAVLQVRADEVRSAVGHLLDLPSVADLTVEDPPLEEVMRELFAKGDEPLGGEPRP